MIFSVCLGIYEDKSKQKILYNQEKTEKKFWTVRVKNFHDITSAKKIEEQVNERVADASLMKMQRIAMWRLQFTVQKKSFEKTRHSSPVTL